MKKALQVREMQSVLEIGLIEAALNP